MASKRHDDDIILPQLLEADDPNGPWTLIPDEEVLFTAPLSTVKRLRRKADEHRYYPRAMSKKEIGGALGLDSEDRKVAEKVNSLFRSWGVKELHKTTHGQYLVPLDGLPKHFYEVFARYVKLCHGVDL